MIRPAVLVPLVVLVVGVSACGGDPARQAGAPTRSAAPVPTLSPQPGAAPVPTRLPVVPAAGTVVVRPGPFDDRFVLRGTVLRSGVVTSALDVTSDVSEVIVAEVTADFYDATGSLLGSARTTLEEGHAEDGGEHHGDEALEVVLTAAPSYASSVHSAVLAVPVLVNE